MRTPTGGKSRTLLLAGKAVRISEKEAERLYRDTPDPKSFIPRKTMFTPRTERPRAKLAADKSAPKPCPIGPLNLTTIDSPYHHHHHVSASTTRRKSITRLPASQQGQALLPGNNNNNNNINNNININININIHNQNINKLKKISATTTTTDDVPNPQKNVFLDPEMKARLAKALSTPGKKKKKKQEEEKDEEDDDDDKTKLS